MLRYLAFLLLVVLSGTVFPARADLPPESMEHARSAFYFAERKDWDNALGHAKASHDAMVEKLIDWQYALDPDSNASFTDITQFINANPDWPGQKQLHIRAELAIRDSHVPDADIIAWFSDADPITGIGKLALAEALKRSGTAPAGKIDTLVHEAWRDGDFDESQEKQILSTYGSQLTADDHIARIDRLLWEDKMTAAKRLLSRVPRDYQKLFKARMALQDDKKLAVLSVAAVPKSLKNDPGLLFDRMGYRLRRGDESGVRELLLAAPARVPYPDRWWKTRDVQIREAVGEGDYATAEKLLANHGQTDGKNLTDVLWLSGWLKCEFQNQPKDAYDIFYRMYNDVHYPVSKARAAYWMGRASEKAGDAETAANWYKTAVGYPTTFYGQLAALKTGSAETLHLPTPPSIAREKQQAFDRGELAQAVRLCVMLGQGELASRIVGHMVEHAASDEDAALAAGLGNRLDSDYLSVRAAKKAMQKNIPVVSDGYPAPATPGNLAIERPLALAITRQESEFDPEARSPTGALGMMQLRPGTAKEIARKHDIGFSKNRLFDPEYNVTLGSLYLARLINGYDGSYVMAIAAYNAGPGNVRSWAGTFGTPANNVETAVDWIEKIPYSETRNYVQRVLENLQVYRNLDAGEKPPELKLDQDLAR